MRKVGIFRLQLFKPSEVFITQQANNLSRHDPVFVGYSLHGAVPTSSHVISLDDAPAYDKYRTRLLRSPVPWTERLSAAKLDLVHAHFAIDGVYALPLAQRLGVPLVVTLHGFDVTISDATLVRSGSPAWINYFLWRSRLKQEGDLFICVSNYIRDQAIKQGFPADRTIVHYMGTKILNLDLIPTTGRPIIAHVARLVEKKGTAYLVEACAILKSAGFDFDLIVIGEGPERQRLAVQVANSGLSDNVRFFGARSHREVIDLLRRSTVLVLPSVTAKSGDAEGLGMVLLEASSLGIPVIGTDNGGITDAIIDEQTGYIVGQRDPTALAERLRLLLSTPELRVLLGKQGKRFVRSRFDLKKQNVELENIWDNVRRR